MPKTNKLQAWSKTADYLSCGRDIDEQVETIKKYGNHGVSQVLRAGVLAAHGIPKPKDNAENCIIFGCYRPFTTPFLLRDYVHLLDLLNIDYTYLDNEQCCGFPFAMQTSEDLVEVCKEFNQGNINLSIEKGADRLVYCCIGCVHSANNSFRDNADQHVYIVDLILDELEKLKIKIPATKIGYFEGCHTFFKSQYQGVELDWGRYRSSLGQIEGVEIIDLPSKMCCKVAPEKIIEKAEKMGIEKILCPCNFCYSSLKNVADGKVQLISIPEFLIESLETNLLSE
ncbi:(Fe-S)-binding protein [Maridesulfovibrio zosterae]|uniref:(Fe-S)-binding protein n=1 Tax=Maridesulfovibrio zosterae TaxID=82171 RepID=UPI0004192F82|nr:(Fe-S)-binding protein [Maridesulfovibrio zosterae]